jgi:hypothetical protein
MICTKGSFTKAVCFHLVSFLWSALADRLVHTPGNSFRSETPTNSEMRRLSRARGTIRPQMTFESREGWIPMACASSFCRIPRKRIAIRSSTSLWFRAVQDFDFINKLLTQSHTMVKGWPVY